MSAARQAIGLDPTEAAIALALSDLRIRMAGLVLNLDASPAFVAAMGDSLICCAISWMREYGLTSPALTVAASRLRDAAQDYADAVAARGAAAERTAS